MSAQPVSRDRKGQTPPELEPSARMWVAGQVAYLDGSVFSYERKKKLEQFASALPSVVRVVNRLRVVPGSPRADEDIEQAVLTALRRESGAGLGDISVQVRGGVVELTGDVPDVPAKVSAEALAWSSSGVQHVLNRIRIASPLSHQSEIAKDIAAGLKSALGVRGEWVEIELTKDVVYLRGWVASADDRDAVEDFIRWYPLAGIVMNELSVIAEQPLNSLTQPA